MNAARAKRLQSQENAMAKAEALAASGHLPTFVRTEPDLHIFTVESATNAGLTYTVEVMAGPAGLSSDCTCLATGPCWHRALCRMAVLNEVPVRLPVQRHEEAA